MKKAKPQSENREKVKNNRSFLFYIFCFKSVIRYFIHFFRLFWFPVLLCSNKSAQNTILGIIMFSIRIPRLFVRYIVIRKVAMCQFSISDESFQNNHYLAGTRVTVKLVLWADLRACYNIGHMWRQRPLEYYSDALMIRRCRHIK
jgi:hypothetical protein